MRAVVATHPGILELNFMWLPTWIGSNAHLKQKIEKALSTKFVGRVITEQELDKINEELIDYLQELHPTILGLWEYIDGLKYVKFECQEQNASTSG